MAATRPAVRQIQGGFTLVELIMVIVIMGVIGGMVSVFMKGPIDAYFASTKRAALTDVADTTVRRIARDLHRALPNSIRNDGTTSCLEFVPTKTGGRYRTQGTGALDFSSAVSSFNMLGDYANFAGTAQPADQKIAANDLIAIYNLGGGISGADVYVSANTNYSPVTSVGTVSGNETPISITAKQFPLASASNRFHVVSATEKMVSYVCSASTLFRTVSNTLTATASCPTSGSKIATNVDCSSTGFSITDSGNALSRNALVSMRLTIRDSASVESVTLHHEVHVDSTP